MQRGSEDRKRSLGRLRWALQNEDTQQKFVRSAQACHGCYQGHVPRGPVPVLGWVSWEVTAAAFVSRRLDGSIRTLTGLFTSSLGELQLEAARCLHELSHSSVPAVAEACLPVTSYLLTYLSGHSLELTVRSICTWESFGVVGVGLFWSHVAHVGVLLRSKKSGSKNLLASQPLASEQDCSQCPGVTTCP